MSEVLITVLISLGTALSTGFGSWIFFRRKHKAEADGAIITNDRAEIESLNLIAKEWRETAQSWKSMADEYRTKYMDYQRQVEALAEQVSELSLKLNRPIEELRTWRKEKAYRPMQIKPQQMVTSNDCTNKYGTPDINMERKHMVLWDIPADINAAIPELPNRLYCNKDLKDPFEAALRNLMKRDLACHIHTWDGCFNIRKSRGLKSMSLHSWGIAVDINAAWNGLGKEPQMPKEVVKCFTDAGFDWGGLWSRKDGMHFQLSKI